MNPFESCRRRLERAEAHNETLATAWNSYIADDPYEASVRVHRSGSGQILVRPVQALPPELTLILGEMLYQLRAALDGCVYTAAILETGQDPPPDERRLGFPVCSTAKAFNDAARSIGPLPPRLKTLVEALQPYNEPALEPNLRVLNFNRALGILNDWARSDRHRELHVVGSWASKANPQLRVPEGVVVEHVKAAPSGFLKFDHEVAEFKLIGYRPGMDVQGNPDLFIDIAVDEPPPPCADNDTLGNRLKWMIKAVQYVVVGFETITARDGRQAGKRT